MARVQCGQGAVRNERMPDELVDAERPASSSVETGRSWKRPFRPATRCVAVVESA